MADTLNCTFDSQHIRYCLIDGHMHVGTNFISFPAFSTQTPSTITIPKEINGKVIEYIGAYAFDLFHELYSVTIKAPIIAFKTHAFANCPKLAYINIPSTVKTLETDSIQCYSESIQNNRGLLVISFDISPQIEYIGSQVFSFKEFTHIYICEEISPEIINTSMKNTQVTVYAPSSFKFKHVNQVHYNAPILIATTFKFIIH